MAESFLRQSNRTRRKKRKRILEDAFRTLRAVQIAFNDVRIKKWRESVSDANNCEPIISGASSLNARFTLLFIYFFSWEHNELINSAPDNGRNGEKATEMGFSRFNGKIQGMFSVFRTVRCGFESFSEVGMNLKW